MSDSDHSDDDSRLFREAVGEVRPVRTDGLPPQKPKPPPRPQQFLADERRVLDELLADPDALPDVEPGDALEYARPGLQRNVLRRLRRGEYRAGADLDLHGLTLADARKALTAFLNQSRRAGVRCVHIVHGKGLGSQGRGPVLKSLVNAWLRRQDAVLAFCSARPADGGTGAVYVLLRD